MAEYYSDYHEQSFTREEMEEALELYFDWCRKNNQEPEVEEEMGLDAVADNPSIVSHVVYHAEMNGFVVEDDEEE